MRQLTASQKIATLENRVAQLEKQAMLESILAKVESKLSRFKPLKVAQYVAKDSKMSVAKFEALAKANPKTLVQLKKVVSSNPKASLSKLLDIYKNKENSIYLKSVYGIDLESQERTKNAKLVNLNSTADLALYFGSIIAFFICDYVVELLFDYILELIAADLENPDNIFRKLKRACLYLILAPTMGLHILLSVIKEAVKVLFNPFAFL